MHKMYINILLLSTLLLLAGCGTKPITVKTKPQVIYKPVAPVIKSPTPLGQMIEEQLEVIDLSPSEEVTDILNKSNSKSYVTTLKTRKFAFSDTGFMKNENGIIDLQILALGKPLLKLKISDDVCVDHHCRTKQEFNTNYLSADYPYDLINNVLTSQPIFSGENMKKTSNGFMQRIKSPLYDIKYKISPGSIYFKDMQNKIIIKMRELH